MGDSPAGALALLFETPREIQPLLHRCLEPDPRSRFASAGEFARALAEVQSRPMHGTIADPGAAAKARKAFRQRAASMSGPSTERPRSTVWRWVILAAALGMLAGLAFRWLVGR